MTYKLLLAVALLTPWAWALSDCEQATEQATWIHWQYVEGNATITESYNAREEMRSICGLEVEGA